VIGEDEADAGFRVDGTPEAFVLQSE